jgi:hypothetical protein
MKRIQLISLVLFSSLLAGCGLLPTTTPQSQTVAPVPEKQGDTIKTGTISVLDSKYYLNAAGQAPVELDSYSVELSVYVGKTVTVTGQYSGDTLFVGKIE